MKEINIWPINSAKLVSRKEKIPVPRKFLGVISGYSFYKTRHGEYAIEEEQSPEH